MAEVGLVYGLLAYAWWGLIPIYFKQVAHIPPLTVLAHRVVWSWVFLAVLVAVRARWADVRAVLADRKVLAALAASTVLLATNWGVFIFAVASGRVLQASLGYFVAPLVAVTLGVTVLRERLRAGQAAGIVLAAAGVVVLAVVRGQWPWIALVLAGSWSGYGLVRKVAHVRPLVGTTVETGLLVPAAVVYLAIASRTAAAPPLHRNDYLLLLLAGAVTAIPLLWFTAAAKRLRLTTLGFLQYVCPTGQLLLAVFAYHETFGRGNFAGFALIWTALAIYSIDSARGYRAAPAHETASAAPPPDLSFTTAPVAPEA
jgi:chloramphenicol-sensitive protein RarD